jgi:hypothetical protein
MVMHCNSFAVSVHFSSTQSTHKWTLVNIYGPCQEEAREDFVEWLFDLYIPDEEDWLLVGDFNFIRSPSNRNKPGGDVNDMLTFNNFIREQHLTELAIQGRQFTWSNMQNDPLLEQLDWFFTSMHWTLSFPNTVVHPQGKPTSDHSPLVVTIQTNIPASIMFCFENYWVAHPGFHDIVSVSWNKPVYKPNSAAVLNHKLKWLRYDLKKWSKSISKLSICIENTNRALLELDNIEDSRGLTIPETNFRRILRKHLLCLLDYQKQYWKKRCTIRWTKFGDENSKFFQAMATERYRRNSISALINDQGQQISDHVGKEEIIYDSFKARLGTKCNPQMAFNLEELISPTEGLGELSSPFTHSEIDEVVRHMPLDKSPGPDGFNGQFLKSCWNIIKHDIYRLCNDFYEGKLDLESINMGYITLIPKIPVPVGVNDYRPITLLNCCLKLITKILANRL